MTVMRYTRLTEPYEESDLTEAGPMTLRETFQTPFDQFAHRAGQKFEVVRAFTVADDEHDLEVLPMYLIRFEDGAEIEAWPEEIDANELWQPTTPLNGAIAPSPKDVLKDALVKIAEAEEGDSNDLHIEALQDALDIALSLLEMRH